MLPPSISRDEFSRLFNLPLDVVDALIDSGRLLCQLKGGEPRIPLDEIEAFFRDGLLRLYQTDAWLTRAAAFEDDLTLLTTDWQEAETPAPVEETEVAVANDDAGVEPLEEPNASGDEPKPDVVADERPAPLAIERRAQTADRRSATHDRRDLRIAQRFVPRRQIDGIFNDVRFTIVQLSNTGLRIRHKDPLVPGDEAKMSFALLTPPRSFVMRAKVVWTSLARFEGGGSTFSISGLRVVEHAERLASAVAVLRSSHDLRPDLVEGNEDREGNVINGISDDDIALIVKAAQHFADDPLEANRWYGRARFALADERVRRDAPRLARDREEVLGIWEYLDRQIEIPKVAGVLAWMKRSKAATV